MNVEQLWHRIAKWYKDHTPRGLPLAKGATERRIAKFEEALACTLPDDVRVSYLLHNGTGEFLLYYGELMSLDAAEKMWKRYKDWQFTKAYGIGDTWKTRAKGPIKPYWWGPARIPLTDNGGGDPVFLDLDPAKGGHRGQLIKYNHEVGPEFVLAKSFSDWLNAIAAGLESGKFVYVEDAETVAPPGMYG